MNLTTLLDNDPRARRRLSLFTTITALHALGPLDDATLAELPLRVEQRGASVHVTLAGRTLGSIALDAPRLTRDSVLCTLRGQP